MVPVLAGAFLLGCAEPPKRIKSAPIDPRDAKIEALEAQIAQLVQTAKDSDQQSNTAIRTLMDHCDQGQKPDGSFRYPVTTANTPEEAMAAVNAVYIRDGIEPHDEAQHNVVKHVALKLGDTYPDVICFDFIDKGEKSGQTCFDPMEITER